MGKGGEGRRREGRAGEGKFAPAPSKYIWIDAAGIYTVRIPVDGCCKIFVLIFGRRGRRTFVEGKVNPTYSILAWGSRADPGQSARRRSKP